MKTKDKEKPKAAEMYPRGTSNALAALKKFAKGKPLFVAPSRRYIPMRHRALGRLFSGPDHPGLPTGCYIEVLGQMHSGKTTLAYACADAVINQPEGTHRVFNAENGTVEEIPVPRKVLFLDYEQAIDADYMRGAARGVVLAETDEQSGRVVNERDANVYVHQPDTLEEGAEVLMYLVGSGEFGLIVVDSVPAMLPEEERLKRMDENTMALLARQMGKLFRKSAHLVRRYGVTVVMVNQWRDKPGPSYGDPRTSPGGKAAGYWDAIKVDVSGPHQTPWFPVGKTANIKTMKNKIVGEIKQVAEYALGKGVGLSAEAELLEAALSVGICELKGRLPNAKVRLLPSGKTERKLYPSTVAFYDHFRHSDKLFEQLWAMVLKKGPGPRAAASTHASVGWED